MTTTHVHDPRTTHPTDGLSRRRHHALRAGYAVVGLGLAVTHWPVFLAGSDGWGLMEGVVNAVLMAMSLLALVGVLRPVRMLPVLLFEVAWKVLWLAAVAVPLWRSGRMEDSAAALTASVLWVVVVVAVVPWDLVLRRYVLERPEGWR